MKKSIYLIIIFIILTSCKSDFESKNTEDSSKFEYTELSLFDDTAISEMQITYKLDEDLFTPKIVVGNKYLTENDYSLIFILNYNQVNVRYNDKEVEKINMTLEPGESRSFNIEIPILNKGRHDFLPVLIKNPKKDTSDEHYIESMVQQMAKRVTLVVDENHKPDYETKKAELYNQEMDTDFIYFTQDTKDGFSKNLKTVNGNDETLFLNVPVNTHELDYSILIFTDFRLSEKYFVRTQEGVNKIPISIKNSNDHKESMFAIAIPNPYGILEKSPKKLEKIPFHPFLTNRLKFENSQ